ncbi:MAG: hypothetical protein AABX51_03850 [Nanoarchaeota archaeon]
MKVIIVALLLSCIIFYGCTTTDKTINEIIKSSPDIQQFLKENPGTIIRTLYLEKSSVEASIEEIRTLCGPQIPIKPYYEVKISASSLDLVAYIDTEAKRLECSVIKSKSVNDDAPGRGNISVINIPPPQPPIETIQSPPPQPPSNPPQTVISPTWFSCQSNSDCSITISLDNLGCAAAINSEYAKQYTDYCNQIWKNNICLTTSDVCPGFTARCINNICKAEKLVVPQVDNLGRTPAKNLELSNLPTCGKTNQAADVSIRWVPAVPLGEEQAVQFSMSESFEERVTTTRLVESNTSSLVEYGLIHSQTYFWRVVTKYADGWLFSNVENFTNPQCLDYFLT